MNSSQELLRENFERWEIRGRGALTFPEPVSPRPPFAPFPGHRLLQFSGGDDGVRHTIASGFLQRMKALVCSENASQPVMGLSAAESETADVIEPDWCGEEINHVELGIRVPKTLNPTHETLSAVLAGLSMLRHPLSFEIVGTGAGSFCQWAASTEDAHMLQQQMQAHFPDVKLTPRQNRLRDEWLGCGAMESAYVEFGLSEFFMWPLAAAKSDPFVSLIGALADLAVGELGLYQVIFTPVTEPWPTAALEAVSKPNGKPFFNDGASLQKATREKLRGPLYGVVLRMASCADDVWRAWEIVRGMAAALRLFSQHAENEFIPLSNDEITSDEHMLDVILRQSHRSGMLLNQQELIGLVHLPTPAVQSPLFERLSANTRPATPSVKANESVCIGLNEHEGDAVKVWLNREQRLRHTHIIGGTGTGKSTLLFQMIRQDLENGSGFAVIDPHGDLISDVLGVVPQHRLDDVVLLDPSDEDFSVGFNILSASSEFEKTQLASDMVSIFRRTSTSWGDQMNSVLGNAIQTFLDHAQGGTLAELRRFLLEPDYRRAFLSGVSDPELVYYWQRTFPQLGGNRSLGPILTRLENFLSPKPIRCMVAQQTRCLDISRLMDEGKILLARLPQGLVGRENCQLLGSLLVMRLQLAAINRQRMSKDERRPFWLYVDEFQDFITQSMAEILTGARKYGLGLVLAHQQLGQLQRHDEVAAAVLANTCARIMFRCSDDDSRYLERGLSHFSAKDIQSLATGDAIVRLERSEHDFNLKVPPPAGRDPAAEETRRNLVIETSRRHHARPRREVEADLLKRLEAQKGDVQQPKEEQVVKHKSVAVRSPMQQQDASKPEAGKIDEVAVPVLSPVEQPSGEAAPAKNEPPDTSVPSSAPSEPGKGGYQHRILQDRIRAVAEQRGFRVMLEMPVGKGRESVDVGLIRDDLRIACEVSVTTTIDHEVGNVRKCLQERFDLIAVVTSNERRLKQIEAAVVGCLDAASAAKVQYFQPEAFLQHVCNLPPLEEILAVPSAPPPTETSRKGWRVKRVFTSLTEDERAAKEAAAFRLLSEEMRLPPEIRKPNV